MANQETQAKIIDGKAVAAEIRAEVATEVAELVRGKNSIWFIDDVAALMALVKGWVQAPLAARDTNTETDSSESRHEVTGGK